MDAEEKQKIVDLLEHIARRVDYIFSGLLSYPIETEINNALEKYPIISGKMGNDLKIREE